MEMKINLTQLTKEVLLSELTPGEYFWHGGDLYLLVKRDTTESPEEGVFVLRIISNSLRTFSVQMKVSRESRSLVVNLDKT